MIEKGKYRDFTATLTQPLYSNQLMFNEIRIRYGSGIALSVAICDFFSGLAIFLAPIYISLCKFIDNHCVP